MASRTLVEKIDALPAELQAQVEAFVEFLWSRRAPAASGRKTFPDELLGAINEDRERLRLTKGLFDTQPLIREFRESGGR
jgi:hypothetical protein